MKYRSILQDEYNSFRLIPKVKTNVLYLDKYGAYFSRWLQISENILEGKYLCLVVIMVPISLISP